MQAKQINNNSEEKNGTVSEDVDLCNGIFGDLTDYLDLFAGNEGDINPPGENRGGDIDLVSQEIMGLAQGLGLELNEHESSVIRWAQRAIGKRGGAGKKSQEKKVYVTHEDFEEGAERDAFLLIYGYAEALFDSNDPEKMDAAIRFFFCHSDDDVTFEEAAHCIDSYIRSDVIRLRIMFEFWIRDWHFEMPFEAGNMPSRIEMAAAQYGQLVGIDLAREAWFEPGIELDKLIRLAIARNENVSKEVALESLKNLVAYHIISEGSIDGNSAFYTTGKNPILKLQEVLMARGKVKMSLDKIHWSRLF